ncbi:hypothetical protein [Novosphingobium sp. PhB165]|uniref:hypothetical protein n=1 Tax=Novosphingobium sp. PhB165 TaxID=2485105 RepID=UPI0014054B66|nr:hypothetical protein [Novosphingobium sp. PhB165]
MKISHPAADLFIHRSMKSFQTPNLVLTRSTIRFDDRDFQFQAFALFAQEAEEFFGHRHASRLPRVRMADIMPLNRTGSDAPGGRFGSGAPSAADSFKVHDAKIARFTSGSS